MTTQTTDAVNILHQAIHDCRTEAELKDCTFQIHRIAAPGSDDEKDLIIKVAAKGLSMDIEAMRLREAARQFERN